MHLHDLEGVPWVSFNVNRDGLRIVATRDGDTLLLEWVDIHDEAYVWAKRHKPLQIGRHLELVRVPVRDDTAPSSGEQAALCPLAAVRDRVFRCVEVDPDAAAVLRGLSEADLL